MSEKQTSTDKTIPAILGVNTADGDGIFGQGNRGVVGVGSAGVGVEGVSESFDGVFGTARAPGKAGVSGHHESGGIGVFGETKNGGIGVFGISDSATGVAGNSDSGDGVVGRGHQGVVGVGRAGAGVLGESDGDGVFGRGNRGVVGVADAGTGVEGNSTSGVGVFGKGGRLAGRFEGDVEVTGDIRLTTGQDFAEDFDISAVEEIEPGTVMVLNQVGELERSKTAYDRKVAGVISGAGDFKPGITLGKRESISKRLPVALMGKVFCMADAEHSPIEIGDLLTTSPTPGHAMKVGDPIKGIGSVIGKALRPLKAGQGLIPILIALQ